MLTATTLDVPHEQSGTVLTLGGWRCRCRCGWRSPDGWRSPALAAASWNLHVREVGLS